MNKIKLRLAQRKAFLQARCSRSLAVSRLNPGMAAHSSGVQVAPPTAVRSMKFHQMTVSNSRSIMPGSGKTAKSLHSRSAPPSGVPVPTIESRIRASSVRDTAARSAMILLRIPACSSTGASSGRVRTRGAIRSISREQKRTTVPDGTLSSARKHSSSRKFHISSTALNPESPV